MVIRENSFSCGFDSAAKKIYRTMLCELAEFLFAMPGLLVRLSLSLHCSSSYGFLFIASRNALTAALSVFPQ
jgi:hypothetical protein